MASGWRVPQQPQSQSAAVPGSRVPQQEQAAASVLGARTSQQQQQPGAASAPATSTNTSGNTADKKYLFGLPNPNIARAPLPSNVANLGVRPGMPAVGSSPSFGPGVNMFGRVVPDGPADPNSSGAEAADFQKKANATWADMLDSSNKAEQGSIQQTYGDEALNERRAAEQNASMGGGVGGGFAGGQAQAQLGGTQQRLGVRSDYAKQQLGMKGAYLQTLIKQAEASKDRNLSRELQAELDKTNLQVQQMNADSATKVADIEAHGMGAPGGQEITVGSPEWNALSDAQKEAATKAINDANSSFTNPFGIGT